jgi:hypothetical protein
VSAGKKLRDELASAAQMAVDLLMGWPTDGLLNAPAADVADRLVRLATFRVPALVRSEAYLEPPGEITVPGEQVGRPVRTAVMTRFTLAVPIDGQASFLRMSASTASSPVAAYGDIDEQAGVLRLHCDGLHDPAEVKDCFEKQLDQLERLLSRTQVEIEAHNQQMTQQLQTAVIQRKAKLLADRNIQASIGYAIKRRPDAETFSVPIVRTRVIPQPRRATSAAANPYVPEPALADADYEAALAVLRNARNALERSPSVSGKLDEEEIRDLLLVTLNAQFEGKAGGEVFNCAGKTDILIREGDRNVFIGECKIFDPRNKQSVDRVVSGALTQLLGYLVWRDTKAELLLFIRDTDVSNVVVKAVRTVTTHSSYKRPGKTNSEERHDFVIHASDANREIHVALLPFLIGGQRPS